MNKTIGLVTFIGIISFATAPEGNVIGHVTINILYLVFIGVLIKMFDTFSSFLVATIISTILGAMAGGALAAAVGTVFVMILAFILIGLFGIYPDLFPQPTRKQYMQQLYSGVRESLWGK